MTKKHTIAKKPSYCEESSKISSGPCPVKEALQFLSGAWTLEIYWVLGRGPLRFGELKRQLGPVSAKVLTHRLRDLEDLGVLEREVKETYPPQVEYSLTAFGRKFEPILESIAAVGQGLLRKSKKTAAQQNS
ncbi:MAG: helix-turn-helix transcriptional regulator [Proteobacteria bacterium]|jgi:DNA-binding HxlR family transcriptional regulator|nr:helix-turn-helix transcriptional regulator [Pseudomonadota bacterium]